jgi:hypothetical protein
MSSRQPAANTRDPSRRLAIRALLILVAITVVLAIVTGVFLFTRPSYAGAWVGPGNYQGSGDPYAVVASLTLEQNPLGDISGVGTICADTGDAPTQTAVTVTGNLSGSTASLTLHTATGVSALFPDALTANGALDQGQLTLSAESPAHLLLTLQHGSRSDFTAACDQLAQPTETPTPEPSATPGS